MKKRVLFVEDEEALQRTLGDALEKRGWELFKATDGERGLELAKKELPGIILLDIILPKKNGFEVLQELRADPATRNIPVMILTNLEGSADVEQALEYGATTYLVKANYNLEDIITKITNVYEHHGGK
jgi:DNA-binding response OmpR family regulator